MESPRSVRAGLAAVAVLAVLAVGGCFKDIDREDQAVIDHLSQLDILTVPPCATELSHTSTKGGGSAIVAIRGASSVKLVYASPVAHTEIGKDIHAKYDATWQLRDSFTALNRLWSTGGALKSETWKEGQGAIARIDARPVTDADDAPAGTKSIVTVGVSATAPN